MGTSLQSSVQRDRVDVRIRNRVALVRPPAGKWCGLLTSDTWRDLSYETLLPGSPSAFAPGRVVVITRIVEGHIGPAVVALPTPSVLID